jgi:O-antigen/teichoic acid export membrane protein
LGVIIRQSLRASAAAYVGLGIGIVNQLFVSTKFLSEEQFALSRMLIENSAIFAALAHLGAPYIGDHFFARFRDDAQGHQGFLVFLLALPVLGSALFTGCYLFWEPQITAYFHRESPLLSQYHYLIVPLTIFGVYLLVLESYLRNNARIAIPVVVREIYLKGATMLLALVFGLGWLSFTAMLYGILALYGSAVIVLLGYVAYLGKFYWRYDFFTRILDRKLLREMLYYGLFIVLGGLGVNVMLMIDRVMLSGEQGLKAAGIFIIAMYIVGVMEIPRRALGQISIPVIAKALRDHDTAHLHTMYQKSALHQLIAGAMMFLLIWCNIDAIFGLLPKGDIYGQGKSVVLALALAKLFDMSNGLSAEIITYSRHFRFATYFVLLMAAFNIGANWLLIPVYSYNGAAWATALTTLIYSTLRVVFIWRNFHIMPYAPAAARVLLIFTGVWVLGTALPNVGTTPLALVLSIGLRSILMLALASWLILRWRISDDLTKLFYRTTNSPPFAP